MKIRYKTSLIMLIVILVVSAFSGYINYRSNVTLIESSMHRDLETVGAIIQADLDDRASKAAALASLTVSEPAVQAALRARDREQLIKLTVPPFLILKEKFGVVDGHFHVPPVVSFLRTYKLEKYGDDLSKVRELILAAQKQQRALKGIEISSTGVSIKGVDVVKDDQGFIGTFEVGVSFASVLENVKKITGFDAAAFVNNDMMNRIATNAPKPDAEQIIGGYRNVFATDWAKIRAVVTPDLITHVNDITYKVGEVHGQFDGLVILPLLDFKGEQIGSIWALGDFSEYQKELRVNVVLCTAFAVGQAIILAALVFIVFSSFFLLPIDDVTDKIRELSEGKTDVTDKITIWAERKDELGGLARNLQTLDKTLKELRPPKPADKR